jgi:hypothetical protein
MINKIEINNKLSAFKWRDHNGEFHNPKDMHTRHVYYTLRMIWNHSAPAEYTIKPFIKYNFSSFYTTEYVIAAVNVLLKELSRRNNLAPEWSKGINHMSKNRLNVAEQLYITQNS